MLPGGGGANILTISTQYAYYNPQTSGDGKRFVINQGIELPDRLANVNSFRPATDGVTTAMFGKNGILTTENGVDFESDPTLFPETGQDLDGGCGLAYGNGIWVSAAIIGGAVYTRVSTDLSSWGNRNTVVSSNSFYGIFYAEGYFIIIADFSGDGSKNMFISTNGIAWTNITSNYSRLGSGLDNNGALLAITGRAGNFIYSFTLPNFSAVTIGEIAASHTGFYDLCYHPALAKWLAIGVLGKNSSTTDLLLRYSTNLSTWVSCTLETPSTPVTNDPRRFKIVRTRTGFAVCFPHASTSFGVLYSNDGISFKNSIIDEDTPSNYQAYLFSR